MQVRFHRDPDTELPHIYNHGVSEDEVLQVLEGAPLKLHSREGAFSALGQTLAGRYLKVTYRQDDDGIFVITAIQLTGNALRAYRRRRRKRS